MARDNETAAGTVASGLNVFNQAAKRRVWVQRMSLGLIGDDFVEIEVRIPHLGGFQRVVPGDFVTGVGGGARHHARKRRFGTGGGLIVKFSADDAVEEGLLFFRVGSLEVGAEIAGNRKGLLLRGVLVLGLGAGILPRLVSPDAERADVRRLRGAFAAEKALRDIPPAFGELSGAEGDIDPLWVLEDDVVVAPGIAVVRGPSHAAARCR